MSLAANISSLMMLALMTVANAQAKEVYVLVVGQSISSNCNQHMFPPQEGIFQISQNGATVPAMDPFEWSDCSGGSMWMPLGEKVLASGMAKKVIFMPIGVEGTKASDWSPGGKAFNKLREALVVIDANDIRFDFAFWHQGYSDIGLDPVRYRSQLSSAIKYISLNARIDKWVIAQHSSCYNKNDPIIASNQKKYSLDFLVNRFPGPDTDSLDETYRYDGCHLNKAGQERMAELWLDAMKGAEEKSNNVQIETLIHFFK